VVAKEHDITQEQLKSLVNYDPGTGVFTWLRRSWSDNGSKRFNGRFAGKSADKLRHDGYTRLRFTLNGALHEHMAHRLAWLYIHGMFPKEEIDHINRNRADNRISNLREASSAENKRNSPVRKTSKSGEKGVVHVGMINQSKPWCAFIQVNKKQKNLGYFSTKQEASAAYKAATLKFHGEFSPYAKRAA
jgi:hypothetical protein